MWIQAVLEPARVVAKIERVLASGGWIYSETQFPQHIHEGAWDITRLTECGHRWLFRRFDRVDSEVAAGPATA